MHLKQSHVRKMFPNHTVVIHGQGTETLFYMKADKKKETVVARIAVLVNDSLTISVPMGKTQTLKPFGNVNFLKGGKAAIRKAMLAENNGNVTETAVDAAKVAIERDQYRTALELLSAHWNKGVDITKWDFLTAPAKHEFHYVGKKKPAAKLTADQSPVQQLAETLSKRPRGSKIPHPDAKLTQKVVKEVMKAADKKTRQPRAKKVTEGQALLAMAGAHFDGNGKLSTTAKPARKPRAVSSAKAPVNAKATKAVSDAGKWSKDDDAAFAALLDTVADATARMAHLTNARNMGLSAAAYDAKTKGKKPRRTATK